MIIYNILHTTSFATKFLIYYKKSSANENINLKKQKAIFLWQENVIQSEQKILRVNIKTIKKITLENYIFN